MLRPEYSYSDLYLQLQYYERLFNKEKWKNKISLDKGTNQTYMFTKIHIIFSDGSERQKQAVGYP